MKEDKLQKLITQEIYNQGAINSYKEELAKIRREKKELLNHWIVGNVDYLLMLVEEHEYEDCTDEDMYRAGNCTRSLG